MFNIRASLSTEVAIKFLQFLRGCFSPPPFNASISSVCANIKANTNKFYCLVCSRGQQEKLLDKIYKQSENWMLLNTQLVFLASYYIIHDRLDKCYCHVYETSSELAICQICQICVISLFLHGNGVGSSLWFMPCVPYNTIVSLDLVMLCAGPH